MNARREVTQSAFYAVMNPLNVSPSIVSHWDERTGYKSEWVMQNSGRVVGFSESGSFPLTPRRYWLPA